MTIGHPTAGSAPVAGSNVKGRAAGAAWTYLLDDLAVRTAVCVGEPSAAALVTLHRLAERVVVLGPTDVDDAVSRRDATSRQADPLEGTADLVYVVKPSEGTCARACRAVARHGRIYVETRAGSDEHQLHQWLRRGGVQVHERFWLTPSRGEARSAIPADDAAVRRFFVSHGVTVASLPRVLRRPERWFPIVASGRRMGLLAGPEPPSRRAGDIPAYLRRLAREEGHDLSGYRYGLSARGQYNSRKVLFYLFPRGMTRPDLIVKTTRDPAFNDRLINEESVLRRVAAAELVPRGTAPRIAFSGEHGGLRIVAETVVEGRSLWAGARPADAAGAYDWLSMMAVRTARRGNEAARQIETRLVDLLEGLDAGYRLELRERAALDRLVARLRDHLSRLPLVFAHGDAATWNSVALEDGRIAFLDWEAARSDGIPLWDLWYFARSRHMTATRSRRRLRLTRPQVLSALRADEELRRATARYVSRLDLPREVVEPLFVLCWADRALREITRLESGELAGGHYIGLVRELLREHDSRGEHVA